MRLREMGGGMLVLLLLIGALWAGVVEAAAANNTSYVEVLSLLVFRAGLTDASALSSWNQMDDTPCGWTGVVCDAGSGMVSELRLDGLGLAGPLGPHIADLVGLRTLSLSRNNFSGKFPDLVAAIPTLQSVNVSYNDMSGPIPALFGNGSLAFLDLSFNSFSGQLPAGVFSANLGLRFVSVAHNQVLGAIPAALYGCAMLSGFNFSGNSIAGNLTDQIGQLGELEVADLSGNQLYGSVPEGVGSLRNLKELWLGGNHLDGALPAGLGNLVNLHFLDVGFNSLGGPIPDLSNLSALQLLGLRGNVFEGNFPRWIGSLTGLTTLDLAGNMLSGPIPSGIGLLHSLQTLSLSGNRFTGSIPTALASLSLSDVDLSRNSFTGPIPADLITANLQVLNLSHNLLARSLSVGDCRSLRVLDVSANYLTGSVPREIGSCAALQTVSLSGNLFSAPIPSEFGSIPALQTLDLSNNWLNGSIPGSLFRGDKLLVLLLRDNVLTGSIPTELGGCVALQRLDLSVNSLSGDIPGEIGNVTSLEFLDLSYNELSGDIPQELVNLTKLETINVSNNQLEGPVPELPANISCDFSGNTRLCGRAVNVSCSDVSPTAAPARVQRTRAFSVSATVAISIAAAVAIGVVVVTLCNMHTHTRNRSHVLTVDSTTESGSPDLTMGKLVMFPRKGEARKTDAWMSAVRSLINKDCEIGRGAFGTVFRATLPDGQTVAVKKLVVASLVKSQEEFEKEVQQLGKIRHQHLVALRGYYWSKQLQLLIYDYIPSGNLYSRLHERAPGEPILDWPSRFRIAMGTALGLAHLHHGCRPQLIHYDVKSSNILLGEDNEARVSDFGLAKLLPMLDSYVMSSKFQSSLGYMAPEFACQSLRINEKCDVYGFGVLLLELVTGRRPVEYMEDDVVVLCDYIRGLLDEGRALVCVDPDLYYYAEDEVLPLIKLGLICTSQIPSHRPSMAEVIQILELIKPLVEEKSS